MKESFGNKIQQELERKYRAAISNLEARVNRLKDKLERTEQRSREKQLRRENLRRLGDQQSAYMRSRKIQ